jgi:hypothetical protein
MRHQIRIGDDDAGSVRMRTEDADRLARLDEQGLVLSERPQRSNDAVEGLPVAGRPADAAIDDQFARPLRDIRVEVVHEHA